MARKAVTTKPAPKPEATKPATPTPPAAFSQPNAVAVKDPDLAPFIYFEAAAAYGVAGGVVRVTLDAGRLLVGDGGMVEVDRVVVAHLRMNMQAAMSLKAALEGALLLASPTTGGKN